MTMIEATLPMPEWVDNPAKEIRGLDLLGLRQPAQTLGLAVLSGIATVTPTVRYFSIRSWIVHAFGRSGLPASGEAIGGFANRIEAAVVLGNLLADPNRGGLVGSDQARERPITSGSDPLSLERLVTSQIAFTIYAGSSDGLCVTKSEQSGLPALILERSPLANAIESVVSPTEFGKLLAKGDIPDRLPRSVLRELGEKLPIASIPADERELLINALMPKEPRIRGSSDNDAGGDIYRIVGVGSGPETPTA